MRVWLDDGGDTHPLKWSFRYLFNGFCDLIGSTYVYFCNEMKLVELFNEN